MRRAFAPALGWRGHLAATSACPLTVRNPGDRVYLATGQQMVVLDLDLAPFTTMP